MWYELICQTFNPSQPALSGATVVRGSLYPALRRVETGWIGSEWAMTETNRNAKYYRLTNEGRKQLQLAEESFDQLPKGVRAVLKYA